MRAPRVLGTGRFTRDLEHKLNGQQWPIDPIKVTVWGVMAVVWAGLVWGVAALLNGATIF
jgi:hypothetical protein